MIHLPLVALDEDMWIDLVKGSPLDEKYRHMAMKGLAGLFRISSRVQEPYIVC